VKNSVKNILFSSKIRLHLHREESDKNSDMQMIHHILYKVLVLSLFILPTVLFAGVDEFSKSIQKKFSEGLDTQSLILLAVGLILAIAGVVVFELYRSEQKRRIHSRVSWSAFYNRAEVLKLSETEITKLEDMLGFASVRNPEAVFSSPKFYEELIDHYLHTRREQLSENDLSTLHSIRDKIGYSSLGVEVPLASSRQFSLLERMLVEMEGKGGRGVIDEINEKVWYISNPFENWVPPENTLMTIRFTRRGDAEYTLRTRVLGVENDRLCLEHVVGLERRQLRKFVRIDVNLPVLIKVVKIANQSGSTASGAPIEYEGRMSDLSAGGTSVRVAFRITAGSVIKIDFDLPGTSFRGVVCKVIRVVEQNRGKELFYQHSLAFDDLDSQMQEKIVQYAHKRQLEELQWR
jgi:c-di-GMP-binding flagellar brake protein YcgR